MRIFRACLFTVCSFTACAQAKSAHPTKPDPVRLLNEVAQNYARARTYHIEAIKETVRVNPNYYEWERTFITAIHGTQNRFRFEVKPPLTGSSWLQISDGKTEWLDEKNLNQYMQQPAPPDGPSVMASAMGLYLEIAKSLIGRLEALAGERDSVVLSSDEILMLSDHAILCYVVHDDQEGKYERTFWIDQRSDVIRKAVETRTVHGFGDDSKRPIFRVVTTTTYPVAELNEDESPATFEFAPPINAKKIATFMPAGLMDARDAPAKEPKNHSAPDLAFVANDGTKVPLKSYRGKPVLLDFWATWCGPCVASMPQLAKLETELRRGGIELISIDEDKDAMTAQASWTRHQYTWTNFHDKDGEIQKAFFDAAIPLSVLIDANGNIVFQKSDWDDLALRSAISKLGPQYASFRPR